MGDMDDELPADYDINGPGTTHQAEIDEIMGKHHDFMKKLSEEFDAKVAACGLVIIHRQPMLPDQCEQAT